VTLCISQFTVVATAFVANAWLAIPITSRAVNVMGKHCVPLRLHCERNITFRLSGGFLKHLFAITFARNSWHNIPRSSHKTKLEKIKRRNS
jgi:hypothetical protein